MDSVALSLSCHERCDKIRRLLVGLAIDEDQKEKFVDTFSRELEAGLKAGLNGSCLQMENTYIPELPNGKEEGQYLALDLGGTNFSEEEDIRFLLNRVMLLELSQGRIVNEKVEYFTVQEATRLGPGEELFDFLALCIKDFLEKNIEYQETRDPISLGFTFSFPMTQKGLDVGILVAWTKSFNCPGVIGQDAVKMLNDAIRRLGNLPVKVVSILNDATGTLVKGAYDDKETRIGLILGTGCNGAYIESASNVPHWIGDRHGAKEVIIDPEFGAFGDNGCIDFLKTEFDRDLDKASLLPGSFTFEKYFAGKYIGELTRLVLCKLNQEKLFLPNIKDLNLPRESITSADVSHFVVSNDYIKSFLLKFATIDDVDSDELEIVRFTAQILSERCAFMVSVPLSNFIGRMSGYENVAIAVTGSLYKHHPSLHDLLEKYIDKLTEGRKFKLFLSDDGSGKGAGLVASIAVRLSQQEN